MSQKFISAPKKIKNYEELPTNFTILDQPLAHEKYDIKIDFSEKLLSFFEKIRAITDKIKKEYFETPLIEFINFITTYLGNQKKLLKELSELNADDFTKSERIIENFFEQAEVFFERTKDLATKKTESQKMAIQFFQKELVRIINETPDNLYVKYSHEELKPGLNDDKNLKKYKRKLRLVKGIKGTEARNKVRFKKILRRKAPLSAQAAILSFVEKWDSKFYESTAKLNKTLQQLQLCLPSKVEKPNEYSSAIKLKVSDNKNITNLIDKQLNIEKILTTSTCSIKINT